jgi:hypothetical protein
VFLVVTAALALFLSYVNTLVQGKLLPELANNDFHWLVVFHVGSVLFNDVSKASNTTILPVDLYGWALTLTKQDTE